MRLPCSIGAPFLFVLAVGALSSAEKQVEPLRVIAERSCKCIEEIDLSKLKSSEQRNAQLGLCVIKSAKGFEKFLLTEKNIDMDRIGESDHGTRLGYLFGVEAAIVCPETLARVTSETESAQSTVAGRVTETQTGAYTRLTVEDMAGRTTTLYWIFNFDNSNLLLKSLADKTARYEFSFAEKEVFFLARKEYQKVKVITGLKKI